MKMGITASVVLATNGITRNKQHLSVVKGSTDHCWP